MGSRKMSVLLEGEARRYSKVKEVGCRNTTSRPWKRLPRASCEERGGRLSWAPPTLG